MNDWTWWQWAILAAGSLLWIAVAARVISKAIVRSLDERKER